MTLRGLTNYSEPIISGATVLGVALVLCALIGSYAAYTIKVADDTVTVTGSAKEAVTADFGRWNLNLEAKAGVGQEHIAIDRLDTAVASIQKALGERGFSDVEAPVASVNATYYYPQNSEPVQTGVSATRTVTIRSAEIEKLAELASDIGALAGAGYTLSSGPLELTYQKLPELRVKLLSGAIKDARERAEAIAKESGRSVGELRIASSGVVQVLPQGGVEVSDYGSYDTQSRVKDVMVTVRADFSLR